MKILFVTLTSIEMNGSAMIRNNALINGLIENGASIEILTIPTQIENSFYDRTLEWDKSIEVTYLKSNNIYASLVSGTESLSGKLKKAILPFLRKIYHSVSIFDNTIYMAKKANKNILKSNYYDLVISSSDPKSSHYAVKRLIESGLKYDKWVQYWGDPLAIDITNKSIYPSFYLKYKEKVLFSVADKIVYVSPFTYNSQVNMYPGFKDKMNFIPIPYIKEKIYSISNLRNKKISVGYFGDYNSHIRDINQLYSACDENDYNLIIAGNSDLNLKQTKNIKILPRVSQEKVEKLESDVDVLVCILNKKGTQIPGKIYHYAATNRPILVVLDGNNKEEMRKYLKKFNRFILCENNKDSISRALNNIRDENKYYSPSPHFNSKNIALKFLDLIK